MNVNEIILISFGPASLPETWSGVPFCLMRELRNRGIIVQEVDLEPHRYIKWLYNRIIMPFISIFVKAGELSVYRSVFFRIYQHFLLRKSIRKYNTADVILGISSFNIKIPTTKKPVILFSDWPFSYNFFKNGIDAGLYQRYYIRQEEICMMEADLVISLFPTCARYINDCLRINNAVYLGVNVVNNMSAPPDSDILYRKMRKPRLLFIGRHHYIEGARKLLDAYNELVGKMPDLELDIIGLQQSDFPESLTKSIRGEVRFWGYLDKGNKEQCRNYYDIINNASLYVNTTPGWVGYTSMIEAMYFYTPVIVYPCREFLDEFGEQINFGAYVDTPKKLSEVIQASLIHNNWKSMAKNAHKRVSEYTWPHFIDKLLESIRNLHKM